MLGAVDSVCTLVAYTAATYVATLPEGAESFSDAFRERIGYFIVFVLVWGGTAADQHLFESQRGRSLRRQLLIAARTALVTLLITVFLMIFLRRDANQTFVLVFSLGTFGLIVLFRLILRVFLRGIRARGYNFRRIIIVGANERARHFADIIVNRGQYGFVLRGILDDNEERMHFFDGLNAKYLGPMADLERVITDEVVDEVYITLPVRSCYEEIQGVAGLCEGVGVPVRFVADFFPLRIARSRVDLMEDVPILSMSAIPEQQIPLAIKRAIDVVASSCGLLVLIPLMFIPLAILIKLESRGPVFYAQERVGLNGRRFHMLKFRSMVANAEELRKELEEHNEADGPVFKIKNDPRITRIGAFIRKYSIDEFPQLLNVWSGQMSLIGPRPPIPSEVEEYSWDQRRRLSVRPGMTGLWQVSGRSETSFEDWVALDLEYIDTWSLFLDFQILWRTYGAVVKGRGAS